MTALLIVLASCANADQNLYVQAVFSQNNPQVGQPVELQWSVTGGSGSYTDVQIEWQIQESCMQKSMQTRNFTGSTGTDSYTPPAYADQLHVIVTATDSNGNTERAWRNIQLEGWQHVNAVSGGIYNDMEYAEVGQQVSARWEIEPANHTISNVRYRWITEYPTSNGRGYEESAWIPAGNNLQGTGTFTTTRAGKTYMALAFDGDGDWKCPSLTVDVIQVLNPGETPVTAEISITPQKPKTEEDFTIAWNTTGTTAGNTEIRVDWSFSPRNGSGSPTSGTIDPASETGTKKMQMTEAGMLSASINIWDKEKDIRITRRVSAEITEPSGIELSVSPTNPQLGQPVTVSWKITRQSFMSAGLNVELTSGNLTKRVDLPGANLMQNKTGSVAFTPTDGDQIKVRANLSTNTGWFQEELEPITLQGTWNTPSPMQVNVTYRILQTRGTSGKQIAADYTITGGTGNISYIDAVWYRIENDGRRTRLHERNVGNNTTGQLTYTPGTDGRYAVIFNVTDNDSGWNFNQDVTTVSETIKVAGVAQTAPGIEFVSELPAEIEPDRSYQLVWDVTGGDNGSMRETTVYVCTDDGIILYNNPSYSFTNYCMITMTGIGPDSQKVIIELTPKDGTTTGTKVSREIPINRNGSGNIPAPKLDNADCEWNWYKDIPTGWPITAGPHTENASDFGNMSLPYNVRDYSDLNTTWELVHVSGPNNFVISHYPSSGWTDSYFVASITAKEGTLVSGDSVYTMRCTYKGTTYEGKATIHTTDTPATFPTALNVKAYKTDANGSIIGDEVPIKNGVLTVKTGEKYYISGALNRSFPDMDNEDICLNITYYGGVMFTNDCLWQGTPIPTKEIYNNNTKCFTATTPGTYQFEPWTIYWYSNYAVYYPLTLIVTESDGTLDVKDYRPFGTAAEVPSGTKKIESEAFAGTKIREVDIPAGVEIAEDAFMDSGLIAVYTHNDEDTIQWAVSHGVVAVTE